MEREIEGRGVDEKTEEEKGRQPMRGRPGGQISRLYWGGGTHAAMEQHV